MNVCGEGVGDIIVETDKHRKVHLSILHKWEKKTTHIHIWPPTKLIISY